MVGTSGRSTARSCVAIITGTRSPASTPAIKPAALLNRASTSPVVTASAVSPEPPKPLTTSLSRSRMRETMVASM